MIIVTSDQIEGKNIIEVLGLVRGNAVRARAIGKNIMAGFKAIVGGEITESSLNYLPNLESRRQSVWLKEQKGWVQMQLLLQGILPLQLWAVLRKY